MKPTKQQNEALYGPSAPSDHAPGDTVRYVDGNELQEGTVIFTRAAGPVASGKMLRAGHIVESGRGWPKFVPLKRVVE
jgi:hypothetical protein